MTEDAGPLDLPADADAKAREAYAGNKKARDDAWGRWKTLLKKL